MQSVMRSVRGSGSLPGWAWKRASDIPEFCRECSNGVIGEFKANLEFDRRPNQRLGVVEAFEESASGSGEDLHLDRVPIVFG